MRKLISGFKGFVDPISNNFKKLKPFPAFLWNFSFGPKKLYCQRCENGINLKGAKINQWLRDFVDGIFSDLKGLKYLPPFLNPFSPFFCAKRPPC